MDFWLVLVLGLYIGGLLVALFTECAAVPWMGDLTDQVTFGKVKVRVPFLLVCWPLPVIAWVALTVGTWVAVLVMDACDYIREAREA